MSGNADLAPLQDAWEIKLARLLRRNPRRTVDDRKLLPPWQLDMIREVAEEMAKLEGELHLLEEVCTFYADDEDRVLRNEACEPYCIPTEVGFTARSARHRFRAREKDWLDAQSKAINPS